MDAILFCKYSLLKSSPTHGIMTGLEMDGPRKQYLLRRLVGQIVNCPLKKSFSITFRRPHHKPQVADPIEGPSITHLDILEETICRIQADRRMCKLRPNIENFKHRPEGCQRRNSSYELTSSVVIEQTKTKINTDQYVSSRSQ